MNHHQPHQPSMIMMMMADYYDTLSLLLTVGWSGRPRWWGSPRTRYRTRWRSWRWRSRWGCWSCCTRSTWPPNRDPPRMSRILGGKRLVRFVSLVVLWCSVTVGLITQNVFWWHFYVFLTAEASEDSRPFCAYWYWYSIASGLYCRVLVWGQSRRLNNNIQSYTYPVRHCHTKIIWFDLRILTRLWRSD